MEKRVKLIVLGITYSQVQNGAYALVLAEENGPRRIPIIIGTAEAQAIAIRLENLIPPRPMTHDLFVSFAHGFGIRLTEVYIYRFEDGVFSSELLFDDGERQMRVDSRTSDAIAIALRTNADIYTSETIAEQAGFILEDEGLEEKHQEQDEVLENKSVKELEELLTKAVEEEAYEQAAYIQQLIRQKR